MQGIDELVPGFDDALGTEPASLAAWDKLSEDLASASFLPPAAAALVGVAVAQRLGCDYARWAMQRLASNAGATYEQITFATLGGATDALTRAVVKEALRLAGLGRGGERLSMGLAHACLLGERGAEEVVARVAQAVIACHVLGMLAARNLEASARPE